jgi:hypothetical protein
MVSKAWSVPVVAVAALYAIACVQPTPSSAPTHVTRRITPTATTGTERSAGRTPSTDSEVSTFLDVLAVETGRMTKAGVIDSTLGAAPFLVAAYDTSSNGKLIPVVIAARPKALSAKDAHDDGRPIVFIEAGAQPDAPDAGATTDAILALLRDLLARDSTGQSHTANLLDSIVLVAVPRARPSAVPATIAAPDTDLLLGASPESHTTFAIFHVWHPDVVIDLQSANLGGAAYAVVVAPPLTPAALLAGPFPHDTLIPTLRRRLTAKEHLETFPCGAIVPPYLGVTDDTTAHVWTRCDHRLRALTNYAGLRNRPALLIRANNALPLARRVAALTIALRETLSLIAQQRAELLAHVTEADSTVEAWDADPGSSPGVPLRAAPPGPGSMTQILVATPADTSAVSHGHPHSVLMAVQEPPAPAVLRRPPLGYVLQPDDSATARLLIRHGIVVQHHIGPQRVLIVERFIIDSLTAPPVHFGGHWLRVIADTTLPAGSYIVPGGQPLDLLTMQLLEPESDDGLATAHVYDHALTKGGVYPIIRLLN